MKLMIAGGGTGGHLFPGIAVARAWLERAPSAEVFFVGTARGLESKVVPQAGFRLSVISQVGLKNRGWRGALRAVLQLPRSFFQSLAIVRREHPQVALGVGGYAAGPAMVAAWFLRVPSLILEPNAMPGLTNRLLSKLVARIVSPYPRAREHFPKRKLQQIGIPVRAELVQQLVGVGGTGNNETGSERSLLIFGGSQGARAINEAAMLAVPELVREGVRVLHQTGPQDFERVKAAYAGTPVDVREFITDMAAAYAGCNLVVCRSGASTLAELGIVGRPSILVPLPTAADDHQSKNAQSFVQAGAAVLLQQKDLSGESLLAAVRALLNDNDQRQAMARAAKAQGDPAATQKLCDLCLQLAKRQRAEAA